MGKRQCGILMHISSLPSMYGIGDFGPEAFAFTDFLYRAKQKLWQILPLSPTDPIYHNSPYLNLSTFALNPLFISPDLLIKDNFIDEKDVHSAKTSSFYREKVDYPKAAEFKNKMFSRLSLGVIKLKNGSEYREFCAQNTDWLDDYALFTALKRRFKGTPWKTWPSEIRDRSAGAVQFWKKELKEEIDSVKCIQFLAEKQWFSLKKYCNNKEIKIIGDLPIYVDYNSSDVWSNQEIYKLDEGKSPYVVAGVPPDYFSETGQLWGNPVYNWEELRKTNYSWWIRRLKRATALYDIVRIDHFRGLVAYWEVKAHETTAINGKWVSVPVKDFLNTVKRELGKFAFIAEDLGIITPDVIDIMNIYKLPGMKVLLFAFAGELGANPYLPHNHIENCYLYTGTHDNNTVRGWYENDATEEEKNNVLRYIGKEITNKNITWEIIRMAVLSITCNVILPMQDLLNLGNEARMNTPSIAENNWQWRLSSLDIDSKLIDRLLDLLSLSGRA
ncbi:MAG: 4-alpha-glucanotransferase [Chitinispirillia bacterium]|jgi:4-alpha-glucanotransferase